MQKKKHARRGRHGNKGNVAADLPSKAARLSKPRINRVEGDLGPNYDLNE